MTAPSAHEELPFVKALPWLVCITLVFFLNFISRAIFSPLMLAIEKDLGINHAQAGGIFFMVSVGYAIALLFSGFVSSRFTHRTCVALAAAWMGLGLLAVGNADSPLLLQFSLIAFGMSGGIYLPSGIAAITSLVQAQDFGKAISVHELAPNMALILAPLLAEALMPFTSWRGVMNVLGFCSLAMAAFFAFCGRGGNYKGTAPNFGMVKNILRMPAFWALGLLFSLAMGSSIGPYSMLPLFLVDERGWNPDGANTLLSLSRLLTPASAIASGWAADRFGPSRTIILHLVFTGLTTVLMGVTSGWALTGVIMVQPFFSSLYFAAGFAAISRVFPHDVRSMAISLIIPFGVVGGMGVFPTMLGACGDMGSFAVGFVILGTLLLGALLLPRFLRRAMAQAAATPSLDRVETKT